MCNGRLHGVEFVRQRLRVQISSIPAQHAAHLSVPRVLALADRAIRMQVIPRRDSVP